LSNPPEADKSLRYVQKIILEILNIYLSAMILIIS
jgi:hypothetical protein